MDASLINPFLESTVNVLETMCKLSPKKGKLFVRKPSEAAEGSVTGIMGIVGGITGTIAVSFEEEAVFEIVSNFLGSKITTVNEDIVDAVGELTNMISGATKKVFSEQGKSFKIAIPTVITGKPHHIHHVKDVPCLVLPFSVPAGKFFVEISLKKEE